MKSAVIAAIVAALVSSGATLAATKINGHAIQRGSIPANRLTGSAVKSFTAQAATAPAPRALAAAVNSTLDYESGSTAVNSDGTPTSLDVMCPTGDVAVGGGYTIDPGFGSAVSNGIIPDGSGWQVKVAQTPPGSVLTVNVSCEPA